MTADANGQWLIDFKDMPKYKNGKIIDYTLTEEAVEGYQTIVTGYDILNRYTVKDSEGTTTNDPNGSNVQNGPSDPGDPTDPALPNTGESNTISLFVAGLVILTIVGSCLYIKKRQVN